jgi:hypothetical protein
MEDNTKTIIEQFVDYLAPELTAHEMRLYLYLFRNSFLRNGTSEVRVGKRTIAREYGTSYAQVSRLLEELEEEGCIRVGDTDRFGTLYTVMLPTYIPLVAEKMASSMPAKIEEDYFTNPNKRREIFERDKWTCQYCGEKVNQKNATLDHFIPRSKKGDNSKDNLRTCCLVCNGIKSGKTYEEAAPLLLKSIQERKARSVK